MPYNKTLEEGLKLFDEKFPRLWLHDGARPVETYTSCEEDVKSFLTSFAEKIREGVVEEEWKRCVDLLDADHSKCVIKESCIGYQNAQSDLMNQPP